MADRCPITVSEAHAILIADEALAATFEARLASGQTLGIDEGDAWRNLVLRARDRIAAYERPIVVSSVVPSVVPPVEPTPYPGGNEPDVQTLFVEAVAAKEAADARRKRRIE